MDSFKRLKVDPRNYRIGPLLFQRFWRLARPYWLRKDAWPSWLAYVFLVATTPIFVILFSQVTAVTAALTNAVLAHNTDATTRQLVVLGALTFAATMISAVQSVVDGRLQLHWRRWLTRYLIDRYLEKRTYYDITLMEDLDNPDQRIQEQVAPFVQMISAFPRSILQNLIMVFVGGIIIAQITPGLFIFVAAYAVVNTVGTFLLYVPTVKQQFEIAVSEADLRYGLLHVRENAETIAFYRGEAAERDQIDDRLTTTVRKNSIYVYYSSFLTGANGIFNIIWTVGPYILLIPMFFADRIQYGAIAQAMTAAGAMLNALTTLANAVPLAAMAAPQGVRLAEILERFDAMDKAREGDAPRLVFERAPAIQLSDVSLETPGGEQSLARDLSFRVEPGQHLVIVGQTGVGKSSLLRAMAGLWSRGRGAISMPDPGRCLFLPQRPYMILGDLKAQLLYPRGAGDISEADIRTALERVRLGSLIDIHGGLHSARDWDKVLSLGEKQRIAFARVLLSDPDFVFLDEATSAVDSETEAILYDVLRQTGATYVSVGHRETILRHHEMALQLFPGGSWRLTEIGELLAEQGAKAGSSAVVPVAAGVAR